MLARGALLVGVEDDGGEEERGGLGDERDDGEERAVCGCGVGDGEGEGEGEGAEAGGAEDVDDGGVFVGRHCRFLTLFSSGLWEDVLVDGCWDERGGV